MAIVVVGSNDFTDVIGTRGFGAQGASKFGAAIQAGRLAYRTAQWAYKRYFNYATKTFSRQTGTATGGGIGIGGGIVTALPNIESIGTPTNQNRQTRKYMVKSGTRRFKRYKCSDVDRYTKRGQRFGY